MVLTFKRFLINFHPLFQLQHNIVMEFNNCYHCPNVYVIAKACKTNRPSNTALRGFGLPQSTYLSECLIDHVARELRKSPEKVVGYFLRNINDIAKVETRINSFTY